MIGQDCVAWFKKIISQFVSLNDIKLGKQSKTQKYKVWYIDYKKGAS